MSTPDRLLGLELPSLAGGCLLSPGLPQHEWLTYYAERFDTVELNTTFYRLPQAANVARWVSQTPPGFTFAVKVSRYITHIKRLTAIPEHLPRLYERIEPLLKSPKLGPLLWQLPPNYGYDANRLKSTLEHLDDGHRHAFEFRHPSWFRIETYSLLEEHGAALVIADRPSVNTFQTHELTTDYTYVRFHAGTRGRNGNYSATQLREWAGRLNRWSKMVDVFAYFNNDWQGYAIKNAKSLRNALQGTSSRHSNPIVPDAGRVHTTPPKRCPAPRWWRRSAQRCGCTPARSR